MVEFLGKFASRGDKIARANSIRITKSINLHLILCDVGVSLWQADSVKSQFLEKSTMQHIIGSSQTTLRLVLSLQQLFLLWIWNSWKNMNFLIMKFLKNKYVLTTNLTFRLTRVSKKCDRGIEKVEHMKKYSLD